MPNWGQILDELKAAGSTHDVVRRKYIDELFTVTNRNIILYYSGWLQKQGHPGNAVNDADKNGFMSVIHEMDRDLGLDLVLHTPGGDVAATESLVDYLRSMFGNDIRVLVPQLALSAGTMIACAAKEIIMGKHSSLGPIDPQFNGIPAHGVVEEFERAQKEVSANPALIPLWQQVISKYHPTMIGECQKAIEWSAEITREWLSSGMFADHDGDPSPVIDRILAELSDHALTKSHSRHLSIEKCRDIGLKVQALEEMPDLQGALLTVHHCCIHTLSATGAFKIIENQNKTAFIQLAKQVYLEH